MELSGVVEAVGKAVRRFKTGDAVLACSGFSLGSYAEYICLPEDAGDYRKGLVVHKPSAMSFAEAAAGLATGGLMMPLRLPSRPRSRPNTASGRVQRPLFDRNRDAQLYEGEVGYRPKRAIPIRLETGIRVPIVGLVSHEP